MRVSSGGKQMKIGIALLTFLGFTVILLSGCGGGKGDSPSEVVKAFYMAANEGDYSKAKSYLLREYVIALEASVRFEQLMNIKTQNGSIMRIEIRDEKELPGSPPMVMASLTIHFKDGSQMYDAITLTKEKGAWKIVTLGPGARW